MNTKCRQCGRPVRVFSVCPWCGSLVPPAGVPGLFFVCLSSAVAFALFPAEFEPLCGRQLVFFGACAAVTALVLGCGQGLRVSLSAVVGAAAGWLAGGILFTGIAAAFRLHSAWFMAMCGVVLFVNVSDDIAAYVWHRTAHRFAEVWMPAVISAAVFALCAAVPLVSGRMSGVASLCMIVSAAGILFFRGTPHRTAWISAAGAALLEIAACAAGAGAWFLCGAAAGAAAGWMAGRE